MQHAFEIATVIDIAASGSSKIESLGVFDSSSSSGASGVSGVGGGGGPDGATAVGVKNVLVGTTDGKVLMYEVAVTKGEGEDAPVSC